MASEKSPIHRFFSGLWRFIDGTRKVVLNLVFLIVLLFVLSLFLAGDEPLTLEPDTTLILRPQGRIVEQYSGSPLDLVFLQATEQNRLETRLRDLLTVIRHARDDATIGQLLIDPSYMWSAGMATLLELEAAIADFKTSGKPVIALADNLSQSQYFLAAQADEIWLNPGGEVWLDGFAAWRNYYKEGLDKLEIEINLFRAGDYKSALEPFVRNDMSPEAREANLFWLSSLWQQYLEGVSRARGVPLERLAETVSGFADGVERAGGDFADFALQSGLVDRLLSRPEANQELAAMGRESRGSEGFAQIDSDQYLDLVTARAGRPGGASVAVIVAEGEIVRGRQPQGLIGSESLADELRGASRQSEVRAVVLRVNSPGGDSFASERVRREVQALRDSGRTVVVSMGNVAASGGYWIAMGANEVWASPATITGSIGVIGMIPTFAGPMAKLGIHSDGVATSPLAGQPVPGQPLNEDLRRIYQLATERTYQDFIELVADARKMTPRAVHEVGRGRVWSGAQAAERGLVDRTGTLNEAIDSAARIAGLGSDYSVRWQERELSTFEAFLLDMTASALVTLGLDPGLGDPLRSSLPLTLFEEVLEDLRFLVRNGGEFTVAAHCLCR